MEQMTYQIRATLVATNVTEPKTSMQRALSLHYADPSVDDIFDTLSDTDEDKDYKATVDALNASLCPKLT